MLLYIFTYYNSIDNTIPAVTCPDIVRSCTVVVNNIALMENLNIVTDFCVKCTAYNNIKFLSFMSAWLWLSCFNVNIRNCHKERFCHFLLEHRGKTAVNKSFFSCNWSSLALSCNRIWFKARTLSLHKICHFNIAEISHLIYKCKAEISFTAFVWEIFFNWNVNFFCHFFRSKTYWFTNGSNSFSDLSYFIFRVCIHFAHSKLLLSVIK